MNKIFAHTEELSSYIKNGDTDYPICVEIELTNACNHKCPKCATTYVEATSDREVIKGSNFTYDSGVTLLNELKRMGVKSVVFTGGGDPLVFPMADELVKYADDLGLEVGLKTNGALITPDNVDNLLRATWIRFSVDAATPKTFMAVHGVDDFYNVIDAIRLCVKRRKKTTIGAAFLVGEETEEEIRTFASLMQGLGVDYVQYRPFADNKEYRSSVGDIEITEMYHEGLKIIYPNYEKVFAEHFKYKECHSVYFVPQITADMRVYACCARRDDGVYLGSLQEKSFISIWHGKKDKLDNLCLDKCLSVCRHNAKNEAIESLVNMQDTQHKNFV